MSVHFLFLQCLIEAGASLIQAATEPLPLSPVRCATGYESTASLSRALFHQSGSQAEKIQRGSIISLRDKGLFIPNKMKLCCLWNEIYGGATCSADMFIKWLEFKKKPIHALVCCCGATQHNTIHKALCGKALFLYSKDDAKKKDQNRNKAVSVLLKLSGASSIDLQ